MKVQRKYKLTPGEVYVQDNIGYNTNFRKIPQKCQHSILQDKTLRTKPAPNKLTKAAGNLPF